MTRFVDVNTMILEFLEPRVGVPVHLMVPAERPPRFVRAWRNGGGFRNRVVDVPMVTIEAWSSDTADASELCERARGLLLREYTLMPLVRRVVEISGPGLIPDPDSKTPRFRFTVEMTVRSTN